jgi:hypothetical protein
MQVSEPSATGPRLNEAGEMLTFFPPTSIEIGVLKLQGTKIYKINNVFRMTSDTGQRTGVDTRTILGCRLCTANRVEKVCNASRVTNNLGSPSVVDRRCVPYYSFPIHGDAVEGRLPVALATARISVLAGDRCFESSQTLWVKGTQVKSPV